MPQALEFNVTTAEPPSTPEPSCSSSPSPLGDTKGMSATPQVHLGGCRGEPGTGCKAHCMAKHLQESFSPPPMQEAISLLVPLGWPGQWYTLDLLVAYKAALYNLRVRARISIEEEEHTFAKIASLTSAPHVSLTSPPSTPDLSWPIAPSGAGVPLWHRSTVPPARNATTPGRHCSPLLSLRPPSGL